jgi:hypothetical protein
VVDAQAARSAGVGIAGRRGYDAAKRMVGRKRHALVDTDGRLLLAPSHLPSRRYAGPRRSCRPKSGQRGFAVPPLLLCICAV